jgi:hypothetical protein
LKNGEDDLAILFENPEPRLAALMVFNLSIYRHDSRPRADLFEQSETIVGDGRFAAYQHTPDDLINPGLTLLLLGTFGLPLSPLEILRITDSAATQACLRECVELATWQKAKGRHPG